MQTTAFKTLALLACSAVASRGASAAPSATAELASAFVGEWTGVRHLQARHYSAFQGVDLQITQGEVALEVSDLTRAAVGTLPARVTLDGRKMSAQWAAMSGQVELAGELSADGRTLQVRFTGEIETRHDDAPIVLSRSNAQAERFFEPRPKRAPSYVYSPPAHTGDGWATGSLRNAPSTLELLQSMMQSIETQNRDPKGNETDAVLLAIDGKLVFEQYFWGYDRATPHQISSDTKSVTSILAGIAADQNKLSTSERVASFFPDYAGTSWLKNNYPTTIEQILSMSAGLEWNEDLPYQDARNTAQGLLVAPDPIAYVLERKLVEKPGTRFQYNSGLPNLVGDAISRRVGHPLGEFAEQHLFAPLGIKDYYWTTQKNGHVLAAGGLYLRPRDMAKVGQMMLDGGVWNNRRILSESWVEASTSQQTPPGDYPYGYYWHLSTREKSRLDGESGFMAIGQAGQYIIVIPRLKAVIVLTSSNWQPGGTALAMKQVINPFIVPALQGTAEIKEP